MRFRSKGPPRGEVLGREQRRLRLIIAGAGLLLMLLLMSGKSAWLTNIFSETSSANKKQPVVPEALLGNGELQPDEVEFVKSDTGPAVRDYASMIDREGAAQMESRATTCLQEIWIYIRRIGEEVRSVILPSLGAR